MNKTKLAFAALLLVQIAPVPQAAAKTQHYGSPAAKTQHFGSTAFSAYDYARAVYGWNAGLYPFNYTPGSPPRPLRSDGKCWVNTGGGHLGWAPC
jgi:hypothetical protein